tara:strand:+ start:637 stop:1176 length:540 start_codon:yes stop_codon:yes gene_type:complete
VEKIEDIQTPKTLNQFRLNLKKFCLGSENNIFIYNTANGKEYKVDIEKISKISDVIELIQVKSKQSILEEDISIILMCDISHIKARDIMVKKEDAILSLKEVYLFNNQDSDERNNFLNSTPYAIEIIKSGGKVNDEKDSKPMQNSIISQYLNDLYRHLFGEYFNTANTSEKEYHLSKYH